MDEGFYKVAFQTPLGQGTGVVSLRGGKLEGGDSMMYYIGSYSLSGGQVSAQIQTKTHSHVPGFGSVLGSSDASLDLSGSFDGSTAHLSGTSPQAPGVRLQAILTKLGS